MAKDDGGYWFTTQTGIHVHANEREHPMNAFIRQKGKNTNKPEYFKNRKSLTSHIKEQLSINLDNVATEKQFAPRRGLNIDSRKLSKNDFNTLKSFLEKNNIRFESNGIYEYFITFKK